ncbi:MAG TPA: hypothetical protein VNH22_10275 [Blastocatellia bacterium]|jgi:hypothetical protein|nr:hypothetical protein [Blastocatellia bacterium]
MFTRKSMAMVLTFSFLFLTIAPASFAGDCNRRNRGRGVIGRNYYNSSYSTPYRSAYYGSSPYRSAYYGSSPYRSAYYGSSGYQGRRYFGRDGRRFDRNRGGLGSTGRALLTVGAPAAVGAGVGALLSGKKGALVGALLGGGGGAAYYLVKRRDRDRRRF